MEKKILKKTKKIAEKRAHQKKFSGKDNQRQVILIFLGIVFGIALGITALALYNRRQYKPDSFRGQSFGEQGKTSSKTDTNEPLPVSKALSSDAINSFSGTITKIKGGELQVDVFYCGKGNKTYAVLATKETVVTKRENRREKEASLSDIKENYNVAIEVLEDINKESRLTAKEIKIMGEINLPFSNTESRGQ